MDLHEAVLAHSGGSWHSPPERVTWTEAHADERARIIDSYRGVSEWGFKDPRSLITLDFWREVIPDLRFVGTFRHPELVAQSLFRRNGGSVESWLDLWANYSTRLLALHAREKFPIVRFDVSDDHYRRSLASVVKTLGLPGRPTPEFFEPSLRHQIEADSPATPSGKIGELYDALCRLAVE
jgi:hypothetical protein